jgi:RNA polymerase sigma-70 factor, ECF subfamily
MAETPGSPSGGAPPPWDPEKLSAEIRPHIQRMVERLCPRWLGPRCDDIVQVAVLRVLRSREKTEENRLPPASFLWKVALRVTVDEIRRAARARESCGDGSLPDGPAPPSGEPDQQLAAREIHAGISDCLVRLGAGRREAVALYVLGNTIPEVAVLLGFGEKRTENLVYRGMADLRKCLRVKGLKP